MTTFTPWSEQKTSGYSPRSFTTSESVGSVADLSSTIRMRVSSEPFHILPPFWRNIDTIGSTYIARKFRSGVRCATSWPTRSWSSCQKTSASMEQQCWE